MSDVHSLDDEQKAAVEAPEAAIVVLAGPGSGKTRVLSLRTRFLLQSSRKSRALLLTFTNKAAAEMKARAQAATTIASDRLKAVNFHTFGAEVLRQHGDLIGIPTNFDILDDGEARELQAQVGGSKYANHGHPWSRSRLRLEEPVDSVRQFGHLYEQRKREVGVLDFDDLVVYPAELFAQRPQIARAYAGRYAHLLIDEFQDTNAVQFRIVSALSPHLETVSVFADDDQAIYGFAGADLAHIRTFVESLEAKQYFLTTNYRCREAVVDAANRLLEADPSASDRRMKAAHGGGEVSVVAFANVHEEAEWVAGAMADELTAGASPESIALLVRNRKRAQVALARLQSAGVPVSDWLGDRYRDRERRALRTVFAVARGELTERQRGHISDLFSLAETDETLVRTEDFLAAHLGAEGIAELQRVYQQIREGVAVDEILKTVRASLASVNEELGALVDPVIANVEAFKGHDAQFTLEQLLNELALGGSGGAPTEGGGVKVCTLHRTKGLQWPHVYLMGMEEDQLPDFRANTEAELAAERRVCFVGTCRAESKLTLTRVRSYSGWPKEPSRFLREMGLLSAS